MQQRSSSFLCLSPGQANREGATRALGTLNRDTSLMLIDDLTHAREPDPGAFHVALHAACTKETLKDLVQLTRRDADSLIAYLHDGPLHSVPSFRLHPECDRPAGRTVLDGVGQQVDEHSLNSVTIPVSDHGADFAFQRDFMTV